jgi:hypothetical protein
MCARFRRVERRREPTFERGELLRRDRPAIEARMHAATQ